MKTMQQYRSRGFTLIELLVVIAIIGILSAVVLASLGTARVKGVDAAITSNLQSIQTQAEVFSSANSNRYNNDGTSGVASVVGAANPANCAGAGAGSMYKADGTIGNALNAIVNSSGNSADCWMKSDGSAYAIEVQSKVNPAYYFCVDSLGFSGTTTAFAAVAVTGTLKCQ